MITHHILVLSPAFFICKVKNSMFLISALDFGGDFLNGKNNHKTSPKATMN